MKSTTRRAIIALDFEKYDVPGLVAFTRSVVKGATNNPNLPATQAAKLPVALADLGTAATTLETTHTSRPTASSKATTKQLRGQADALMGYLRNTADFIEGLANTQAAGDYTLAQSIITSFGFSLKKTGVKPKKGFEADSPAKGTMVIHVPGGKNGEVKFVRYSADGGKTWSMAIVVHFQDITLTNLTSGVDYVIQMALVPRPPKGTKQVLAAGSETIPWGDSITCVVK